MQITATIHNAGPLHRAEVATAGQARALDLPAKPVGGGSAVNGGELLMLALATCYCNDLYREAARLGIELRGVEVEAQADFAGVGIAASNVTYRARVDSPAPPERIEQLLRETDAVAEVHNSLRTPVAVQRQPWESNAAGR